MDILYLEWNSYCNEDMKACLVKEGHRVEVCPFAEGIRMKREMAEQTLIPYLEKKRYDFVFTFNYMPDVSDICNGYEVPYVSWVYDSPYIHVYSYTVLNKYNYIFLFDYVVYQELADAGIQTVYYLPLAVGAGKVTKLNNSSSIRSKFQADVSFVGSLYDEPKNRLYDKFSGMEPFAKGYLDAVIAAQRKVYGCYFLNELLNDNILEELQRVYPTDPHGTCAMRPQDIYADYVLARQVTTVERQEIMAHLGRKFPQYDIRLYTTNEHASIPGIKNCGRADYYKETPYIFYNSKINLNITLKSIKTGIPLRAFEIMGNGGFLLTNYQSEMLEYFEPDKDFVYYTDYEDLLEKVDYYLQHDAERRSIALNGYEKVQREHTFEKRVESMLEVVRGNV